MSPSQRSAEATPASPGDRPTVVVVAGPTASGKSGLALALAAAFGGTVINADSMQVYRELEILTARPGAEALATAPHRLYGSLPGSEVCSAGRWRALAEREIAEALAAGRLPIVAGGSGLYLKALERGLVAMPAIPEAVRGAARSRHAALGGAAFHAALAERDPAMAARLHPRDSQRLIRAWEVLEATGRSLADWQTGSAATPDGRDGEPAAPGSPAGPQPDASPEPPPDSPPSGPWNFLRFTLLPERMALYAACDRRFEAMVEAGALDEARRLRDLALDPALPLMKALGLRPLLRHLAGEIALAEAVAQGQTETRRYAKRQLTWLRTQVPPGRAVDGDSPATTHGSHSRNKDAYWTIGRKFSEDMIPKIFSIIRGSVLTLPR